MVWGGRPSVRAALYMGALVGVQGNFDTAERGTGGMPQYRPDPRPLLTKKCRVAQNLVDCGDREVCVGLGDDERRFDLDDVAE